MKHISIDKPCTENWGAMTPTEQGAFCGKCQLDVIDFSNKSKIEVKLILEESVGKNMCGRFKKTQLNAINRDFWEWENQDTETFQSKFVYVLMLVFGLSLFSCKTSELLTDENISFDKNHDSDSVSSINRQDSLANPFDYFAEEKVIDQTNTDTSKTDSLNYKKVELPFQFDTIRPFVWEIEITTGIMIMGGWGGPDILEIPIFGIPGFLEVPIDSTQTKIDETSENSTINPELFPLIDNDFSVKIYPNPTKDKTTAAVLIADDDYFMVELFDINGNKLNSIYEGWLSSGKQEFEIALSMFQSGTYLLVVSSSSSIQTIKINKVN